MKAATVGIVSTNAQEMISEASSFVGTMKESFTNKKDTKLVWIPPRDISKACFPRKRNSSAFTELKFSFLRYSKNLPLSQPIAKNSQRKLTARGKNRATEMFSIREVVGGERLFLALEFALLGELVSENHL